MNADLPIELGHATVASEAFRELVYNVAGPALDRIERAQPEGVPRNGGKNE